MTSPLTRRGLLGCLAGALAAPLVARASTLMPLRGYPLSLRPDWCPPGFMPADGRLVDGRQFPELFRQFRACGWPVDGQRFRLPDLRAALLSPPPESVLGWPLDRPPPRPSVEVRQIVAVGQMARPNGSRMPPGWTTALQVYPRAGVVSLPPGPLCEERDGYRLWARS